MTETDDAPLGATDRALMWRVAGAWVRGRPRSGSGSRLLDATVGTFTAVEEGTVIHTDRRLVPPFDLGATAGWIVGKALGTKSNAAVPVATVQIDGDSESVTRCCIRVALFREREDATIDTTGWRFELAESGDAPLHPYQHAQHIIGWAIDSTCLLHPPARCPDGCRGLDASGDDAIDAERLAATGRVNQSHPAFPFATRTMTGLIAAAMVTLYGAPSVRELVEADPRLSRASGAIADDFAALWE